MTDVLQPLTDEQRLRVAEERFRLISEMTSDYAFSVDIDEQGGTHIEWITDSLLREFGYTREELDSMPGGPSALTHPDDRKNATAIRAQLLSGSAPVTLEHRLVARDGTTRWARVHLRTARDLGDGRVTRIIGAAKDITAEVEAHRVCDDVEARLRQSERLESVGQLAGGIAHDFNNLLAVIIGCTEFVQHDLQPISERWADAGIGAVLPDIEQIRLAAERAADLTRRLLVFSRRGVVHARVINVNDVVRDLETMLRRTLGEQLRMTTSCAPSLWNVRADQGHIEQVLVNLVVNARDAMPSGGTLEVGTCNLRLEEDHARGDLPVGEYVCLSVSDSGCGIPREVLDRVFEPFFTTKPKGKGTGLGLATVYGIVSESGGMVNLYSEPGFGTTARVYLPRELAPSDAEELVGRVAPPAGRGERVLLVEDDDWLRDSTRRILERAGYRVTTATGPHDALDRQPDDLQLLLTDVVMQGESGRDLARRITAARPHVRVIYMSGYTYEVIAARGIPDDDVVLVEKPFTADALLRAVSAALAEAVTPR